MKLVLTDVGNLSGAEASAINTINNNSTAIELALENTLSRDGTTPNEMGADIDLNGNDLLNVGTGEFDFITVGGETITSELFSVGPKGWSPKYAVINDGTRRVFQLVGYVGGEGTEPTDNVGQYVSSSGYTATIGSAADIRGPAGAGTGDLLAANNLSDISSASTAFGNIKQAATTSATGVVELATSAEALANTDTVRAVTPSGLWLPPGFIYGCTLSNNSGDITNDIDISSGKVRSSDDTENLILSSALTKRLDAAWAVGSGNGGLDTGSIANTVYHIHLIKRTDTGVVDALFSTSATSPTLPTNYTVSRRIGSVIRVSGAIKEFIQHGNIFRWKTPVLDINQDPTTSYTNFTLTVPTGFRVIVEANVYANNANFDTGVHVKTPDASDGLASTTVSPLSVIYGVATGNGTVRVLTNSSGQVSAQAGRSNTDFRFATISYEDYRGQY